MSRWQYMKILGSRLNYSYVLLNSEIYKSNSLISSPQLQMLYTMSSVFIGVLNTLLVMICKARSLGWTKKTHGCSIKRHEQFFCTKYWNTQKKTVFSFGLNNLNLVSCQRPSLYWWMSNSRGTGTNKTVMTYGTDREELDIFYPSCTNVALCIWKNSCSGMGILMHCLQILCYHTWKATAARFGRILSI